MQKMWHICLKEKKKAKKPSVTGTRLLQEKKQLQKGPDKLTAASSKFWDYQYSYTSDHVADWCK